MKERFNVTANIPTELVKKLYLPLKETYPGTWEDFNALMLYMGILGSIGLWDTGLELLQKKGEAVPPSGTKERKDWMAEVLVEFLDEVLDKAIGADPIKKKVEDFCEDFRRNL